MKKLALSACLLCFPLSMVCAESPRDAATIVQEYEAVKLPTVDATKISDQAWVRQYVAERSQANAKRSELALELYRLQPTHPQAATMMVARWSAMTDMPRALEEIESFLKEHADSKERVNVLYHRATVLGRLPRQDAKALAAATDEFIKAAPQDPRGASLLTDIARRTSDKDQRATLLRRIIADYAGSKSAMYAQGGLRQIDGIGQPFDLAFSEAMSDKPISLKGLSGKVVVIDFWATWCGPCIAEMPKMKQLYAQYKDQGVEFIGVSLDQPGEGLNKLKAYVQEHDIQWPQYYQGNSWQSEFSQSWGINAIPCVFIVDSQGNLYSTEARGKLETLIPQLIKNRDG